MNAPPAHEISVMSVTDLCRSSSGKAEVGSVVVAGAIPQPGSTLFV